MRNQRSRDTAPEVALRRLLHARGLRFRVHLPVPEATRRSIDIAFTRTRTAVLVDGCFWHGCPKHASQPKGNAMFWREKLSRNVARDRDTDALLAAAGWHVIRVWEHEEPGDAVERILQELKRRA